MEENRELRTAAEDCVSRIKRLRKESADTEYTDTGDVWELLDRMEGELSSALESSSVGERMVAKTLEIIGDDHPDVETEEGKVRELIEDFVLDEALSDFEEEDVDTVFEEVATSETRCRRDFLLTQISDLVDEVVRDHVRDEAVRRMKMKAEKKGGEA